MISCSPGTLRVLPLNETSPLDRDVIQWNRFVISILSLRIRHQRLLPKNQQVKYESTIIHIHIIILLRTFVRVICIYLAALSKEYYNRLNIQSSSTIRGKYMYIYIDRLHNTYIYTDKTTIYCWPNIISFLVENSSLVTLAGDGCT